MYFRKISLDELWNTPGFVRLCLDYEKESSLEYLKDVNPKYEKYKEIENNNELIIVGAYSDDAILIGFTVTTIGYYLHYDVLAADTESLYVDDNYRKGNTGLKLIRTAEEYAKQAGAEFFYITAPAGGRLEKAARLFGYKKANVQFIRVLK